MTEKCGALLPPLPFPTRQSSGLTPTSEALAVLRLHHCSCPYRSHLALSPSSPLPILQSHEAQRGLVSCRIKTHSQEVHGGACCSVASGVSVASRPRTQLACTAIYPKSADALLLLAMGNGSAKGRDLGIIDMRSIAFSVAELLSVSLPAAQASVSLRQRGKLQRRRSR